jgi:AraC family transcriptional regulator
VVRKSVSNTDWLAAANHYLKECFAAGTPPHVNELARVAGLSPRSLGRVFQAQTGVRVSTYFKNARIEYAQDLLRSTSLTLNEIARAAGFGTRSTFFSSFKDATGLTPEEFRHVSGRT